MRSLSPFPARPNSRPSEGSTTVPAAATGHGWVLRLLPLLFLRKIRWSRSTQKSEQNLAQRLRCAFVVGFPLRFVLAAAAFGDWEALWASSIGIKGICWSRLFGAEPAAALEEEGGEDEEDDDDDEEQRRRESPIAPTLKFMEVEDADSKECLRVNEDADEDEEGP